MTCAYIFPGQGSQFVSMGQNLYDNHTKARELFQIANNILGFSITDFMLGGTEEMLQKTNIAQPAIFIHSTILAIISNIQPSMVAGHSLGELSALVANQVLTFEDGLQLVIARAAAMQKACENNIGTMAAILGLSDEIVTKICEEIKEVVTPANYNCPGQIVISGTIKGVKLACEALQLAGAKKVVPLKVSGAFHSPLMKSAQESFKNTIDKIVFKKGTCPIYQNVTALSTTDPEIIKKNLILQITSPIFWTRTIQNMVKDGATGFLECGPGKILQGLVKKIDSNIQADIITY